MPERRLNLFSILATEKDTENCHHMEKIPKSMQLKMWEGEGEVLQWDVRQAVFLCENCVIFSVL